MANQLRNVIENDQSGQDEFYIRKLTNKDIADAGLSEKATKEYQEILKEVNQYRTSYNVKHLDNPIKQEDYHGEISATDTSKLETEGTTFERQEDIKSKDINHLTVSTDLTLILAVIFISTVRNTILKIKMSNWIRQLKHTMLKSKVWPNLKLMHNIKKISLKIKR